MDNQETCAKEIPPKPEEMQGNVSAHPSLWARIKGLSFLPIVSAAIILAVVGFLPNNPISREICCVRLWMESILQKNDQWPPLPLWARYYLYAHNLANGDGLSYLEKALNELRKCKGSDYWIALVLHEKLSAEQHQGRSISEADLRESLEKFLATRGPRDSRAAKYWSALGEFYETVYCDHLRAKQCYERSVVCAFISQSEQNMLDLNAFERHISRILALTGDKEQSLLIDKERDFRSYEVNFEEETAPLHDADCREERMEMPGWPLPHHLDSAAYEKSEPRQWTDLHDSPKEIHALYQSVLKSRAKQIRSESPEGATIMNQYAGFLRRQGRVDEAAKLDKKVIEIRDRQPKPVYLPANWKQLADDTSLP